MKKESGFNILTCINDKESLVRQLDIVEHLSEEYNLSNTFSIKKINGVYIFGNSLYEIQWRTGERVFFYIVVENGSIVLRPESRTMGCDWIEELKDENT